MLQTFPTIIAGGVGVAHGVAAGNDVQNGRANPDGTAIAPHIPFATIVEVGALVGGVAADIMRFNQSVTEPLILAGAALLGHRGGKMLSKQVSPAAMWAQPFWGHTAPDLQLQRSSESWLGS